MKAKIIVFERIADCKFPPEKACAIYSVVETCTPPPASYNDINNC